MVSFLNFKSPVLTKDGTSVLTLDPDQVNNKIDQNIALEKLSDAGKIEHSSSYKQTLFINDNIRDM